LQTSHHRAKHNSLLFSCDNISVILFSCTIAERSYDRKISREGCRPGILHNDSEPLTNNCRSYFH